MADHAFIKTLRKQTRDLYVALNQLAMDALAFYAQHPEDLSARLLKELHSITNTVSKTLEKTPEVILDGTNRGVELAKINQEFELMTEIDWFFLIQSNPDADRMAFEREMQMAKEERIRELDEHLRAASMLADDLVTEESFPDQESFGLAGQVRNLLTIVDAKLEEAKGKPMEALQSSMLREAVNILGSATGMVDRLEAIVVPSEGSPKPQASPAQQQAKPKKRKKATKPKIEAKPVDFGELKIKS